MNIVFYSVYDKIGQRAIDLLKVMVHSYDETNSSHITWVVFYFSDPDVPLRIKSEKVTFIFKKVKFFRNTLNFRDRVLETYANKDKMQSLTDCFSYKLKALEVLSRLHKFDLVCHADFDLIFLKDLNDIFEYALKSDEKVFGTSLDNRLTEYRCWDDVNVDKYINIGFCIFKPQRIFREFVRSEFLNSYCIEEAFLSKYIGFDDIKNLQLIYKDDDIRKYYVIHLSHCLLEHYEDISYMIFYYWIYRRHTLASEASAEFKNYILGLYGRL